MSGDSLLLDVVAALVRRGLEPDRAIEAFSAAGLALESVLDGLHRRQGPLVTIAETVAALLAESVAAESVGESETAAAMVELARIMASRVEVR